MVVFKSAILYYPTPSVSTGRCMVLLAQIHYMTCVRTPSPGSDGFAGELLLFLDSLMGSERTIEVRLALWAGVCRRDGKITLLWAAVLSSGVVQKEA